jgi:methyl-accepting chemotaxis protein
MSPASSLQILFGGQRRRQAMERLREAVAAHLTVLPVAGAQLRDTSRQIEEAVAQVGGNFERMVECSREGVAEAARLIGEASGAEGEGRTGVDALLAASRGNLEHLLERIVQDGEICQQLVKRMNTLEADMGRIVRSLADVDRISFGNTILALNAKIQAAHLGEIGQGFEIVAQELWSQARRSQEITGEIRATTLRLAADAKGAMGDIGQMACSDRSHIAELQTQAHEAMDQLDRTHTGMRQSLTDARGRSETLAADIAGAVQSLQFQDRVSQQLAHIVDALALMQAAISSPLEAIGGDRGEAGSSEAARLLAGSYTMEGERAVHAAALGHAASGETNPGGSPDGGTNGVEIF